MDRTELLSFYISRGITQLSQIRNKIITAITIDTNGDLKLVYNDLTELRVPRRSSSGQSVHIKQLSVSGELNTLSITDSNDVVYQLGDLSSPVVADGIIGDGVYLGYVGGKHVFKPLVFSTNFLESNGLYGVVTTGGSRVGSKYIAAQSLDHAFGTSSNIWRNRPFVTLSTNIAGVSLNADGINIPAGKYWVKATAPAYMCNNSSIRITSTTDLLVDGGIVYSRNVANELEAQNPISGYFELLEDDQVILQTMHQTAQARTSWGRAFIELWKL